MDTQKSLQHYGFGEKDKSSIVNKPKTVEVQNITAGGPEFWRDKSTSQLSQLEPVITIDGGEEEVSNNMPIFPNFPQVPRRKISKQSGRKWKHNTYWKSSKSPDIYQMGGHRMGEVSINNDAEYPKQFLGKIAELVAATWNKS